MSSVISAALRERTILVIADFILAHLTDKTFLADNAGVRDGHPGHLGRVRRDALIQPLRGKEGKILQIDAAIAGKVHRRTKSPKGINRKTNNKQPPEFSTLFSSQNLHKKTAIKHYRTDEAL